MDSEKIFDDNELILLRNVEILKYREIAYEKVKKILREVKIQLDPKVNSLRHFLPTGSLIQGGKISKGEQLNGLPYMILDYPRFKQGDDLLLFRTMFWWGHYFSVTLHLQGDIASRAFANLPFIRFDPTSRFSIDEDWNHDVNSYLHDAKSILQIGHTPRVLKIAQKITLANSTELPNFSLLCYETWIKLIGNS